jgi:hypothetical protein
MTRLSRAHNNSSFAIAKARELFPFQLRGVDFDNDSAFNERARCDGVP